MHLGMPNKTVLITGTSEEIGLETALAFGRAGYKVVATMRNPEAASGLKQQIQHEKLDISISEMDVDSDLSVQRGIADIINAHGAVDVLVNNAGIERHGSVEEMSVDDFQATMKTNFFGALRCIKAVLPCMRKHRKGCIINVKSVSGRMSTNSVGAYAASKFALEAVSEALAQELKPFNIKVRIVELAIMDTQMAQDISSGGESIYPKSPCIDGLCSAALTTPTPTTLAANKILEIAQSNCWIVRHLLGPDAAQLIEWRNVMTDEQRVN